MEEKRTKKEIYEDYDGFVAKFRRKKTTDECMTPPAVYDVALQYIRTHCREELRGFTPVRPFWPDTEYTQFDYQPGCAVVDNPPFSCFASIVRWYIERGIPFFLFYQSQTAIGNLHPGTAVVMTNITITYANGAKVNTSFVTNMLHPDIALMTDPQLRRELMEANRSNKSIPKTVLPDDVISFGTVNRICKRFNLTVLHSESEKIRSVGGGKYLRIRSACNARCGSPCGRTSPPSGSGRGRRCTVGSRRCTLSCLPYRH